MDHITEHNPLPYIKPHPLSHTLSHLLLTFPPSMHLVSMTTVWTWFSHIILQKEATVFSVGPNGEVAMVMTSSGTTLHRL